jgi:hypothetical protein
MLEQANPSASGIGSDSLATLVREKFEKARNFRQNIEVERWLPGEDAFNGVFDNTPYGTDNAPSRPPFMAITRREVSSAHIKINAMLFRNGEIPFAIQPTRYPRFIPSDIHQFAEGMAEMTDRERQEYLKALRQELPVDEILKDRAANIENRIRDILDKTKFTSEISKAIHELILHGTGVMKSPVLQRRNYPVYKGRYANRLQKIESAIQEEYVPSAKFVSIFDLYPSPEAENVGDLSYIIERRQLSSVQVRQLLTEEAGYDEEAVADVLERKVYSRGTPVGQPLNPHQESYQEEEKEYELLEFWGTLDVDDLEGVIDSEEFGELSIIPVCVYVLGDKTVKATISPYDGMLPYHFGYWQQVPHSIWGDGIFWSIRDIQSLLNFSMAMYVEGKQLSSMPILAVDPSQIKHGQDLTQLTPGMPIEFAPGTDINSAFRPIIIPDVTHGMMDMMQFLQREANLSSGQSPIGMGESSSYQSKTATGMSILNTNSQKQTASVIQSISHILQGSIDGIYRWILVDSDDPNLHCDAEAICTGYERFVAEEIHNQQMLQFLQIVMNVPNLVQMIRLDRFAKPMLRAFSLDPEEMLKTPQERQQEQQSSQQQVMEQMQLQAQAKAMEAQIDQQKSRMQAALDERLAIGEQRRELEIKKILMMLEAGVDPGPISDFSDLSVLLKEELQEIQRRKAEAQLQMEQQQQIAMAQQEMNAAPRTPTVPDDTGRNPNPRSKQRVEAPQRVFDATSAARNGQISPSGNPGGLG